jgi:uncharacterized circularly permuted ATP-grasp superfamily protein
LDEAGGYGISIGNKLSKKIEEVRATIKSPRKYIAQPYYVAVGSATYIEKQIPFERHVDLEPSRF